jgi:hypothetical protein
VELCRYEWEEVFLLLFVEDHHMEVLETRRKFGGLNCVSALGHLCDRTPEKIREDGIKGALKQKETGTGMFSPNFDHSVGARKAAPALAEWRRNNPEKAHVTSLKGGRAGGRRRIELHGNPATPEGCHKGGRKGGHRLHELYPGLAADNGRRSKETGTGIFSPQYDKGKGGRNHKPNLKASARGGHTQGQRNVTNKTGLFSRSPEMQKEDGRRGAHLQYHLRREQANIMCDLCVKAAMVCACLGNVEDVVGFVTQFP